jgi:hypothetical protein
MSMTTKSMLAAAALLGALLLLSGATEEPESNCPVFAWPNSESACLDDSARPSPPRKKVYFAADTLRPLAVVAFA